MRFLIENIENISNLDIQREYEKCINTLHNIGVPISVNTTLKIERHTLNKSQKTSKGGLTTRKNDGNEYIITIYLYGNETLDDIINVLYHELLHTIPGGMSHTGEWKAWADVLNRRLNINIQRIRNAFSEEEYDSLKNNPRYKYSITCPKCGKEWHFTRETNAIRAIRAGSNRIRCPYDYEPLYISRAPGLKEDYLDKERTIYDYGTEDIEGDNVVDTSRHEMSYYCNFLNPKDLEYMQRAKGLTGKIVQMTPNEYFDECSKIFNKPKDFLIDGIKDDMSIDLLKKVLTQYKKKICIPMLNRATNVQEGRHRMYVLGELYGWDKKFPVLVVTKY